MNTLYCKMLDDGKLPDGAKSALATLLPKYAGKEISITIAEKKDKRNLEQNKFYWKVIVPHVREVRAKHGDMVGEDTAHEDLLFEFAPRLEGRCIKTDRQAANEK